MTEFLNEALKELPALALFSGVMIAVIRLFMKFMEDDRTERKRMTDSFQDTVKIVGESCHTFQREMKEEHKQTEENLSQVIDRNTHAIDENTKAFARIEPVLERIEGQK